MTTVLYSTVLQKLILSFNYTPNWRTFLCMFRCSQIYNRITQTGVGRVKFCLQDPRSSNPVLGGRVKCGSRLTPKASIRPYFTILFSYTVQCFIFSEMCLFWNCVFPSSAVGVERGGGGWKRFRPGWTRNKRAGSSRVSWNLLVMHITAWFISNLKAQSYVTINTVLNEVHSSIRTEVPSGVTKV